MSIAGLIGLLKLFGPFLPAILGIVIDLITETPDEKRRRERNEIRDAVSRGRRGLRDLERIVRDKTT